MGYKVNLFGRSCELPARTLAVEEQIEEMGALDRRYASGEMTRREVIEAQYAFVDGLIPGVLPPVEELDVNDLLKACLNIVGAYNAPAVKARSEANLAAVKELMARPELQKALQLAAATSTAMHAEKSVG